MFGKERQEIALRSHNVNNGNYIFFGAGDLGGLGRLLTKAFGLTSDQRYRGFCCINVQES